MVKRTAVILSLIIFSLLPIAVINTLASSQEPTQLAAQDSVPPSGTGIAANRHEHALINSDYLMVYGPDICTAWGDPFSPITPTWAATSWLDPLDFQGIYTYHFRIRIPADYPDDVVRVELLDPDSINQTGDTASVVHSQVAQLEGFPATQTMNCIDSPIGQKNACAISTGEETLVGSNDITIDHINPFWFVRVDENRGDGTPGVCADTNEYSPTLNTQTRYTLSYFTPTGNGDSEQVILASYLGQTGDGIRDNGNHDTDLRWVSPGAQPSFDHAFVPAEQGDFEVDLTQDTPDLTVDPVTGDRFLYLDITSLSGASRNAFAIWAGPDDYVNTTPSNVNERNLHSLNNPGSHYGRGVKVEAIDFLPRETTISSIIDYPLVELGPEYAGQTITVSLFDPDVGSKPPVIFYMDTLAFNSNRDQFWDGIDWDKTDWAVSFGGDNKPEFGCFKGGDNYNEECQNAWVSYQISLPDEENNCYDHPVRGEECIPFYGGQLLTQFKGGKNDAHVWHVEVPERPLFDNSTGCSAFPISTPWDNRSVRPPGQTGANAWPTDFDYPSPAPNYNQYYNHVPNRSLEDARPGYLYLIADGQSSYAPAFLAWNVCSTDPDDLANSLTWPGNTKDYTPGLEICPANGLPVFPGFMESGDPSDLNMNIGDWVAVSTGSIATNSVQEALEDHIDRDRILRLLIWDDSNFNTTVKIKRFGLFRLVGYGLYQGTGEGFIMVEFISWDESCGSSATPLDTITLDGPANGLVNTSYPFTATVSPINVTPPITVVWSATDSAPFTQTNKLESNHAFQWSIPGTKTITVTASSEHGDPVTDTIEVTIEPLRTFLPLVTTGACETHTAVLNLDIEPTAVSVNDTFTVTATLENTGCANIGLPQYRLTASPELIDPAAPDPITHYLGLGPGDSDSAEFVVTAVSPGTLTLNGNVSFEVHLGYPGPAYWSAAGTTKEITINP